MEITIRKADAADLDAVVRVYEHVHDAEEAGPAQVGWVRGVYPVRSTAEAALERGDLFVEKADGAVVGTYFKVDGKFENLTDAARVREFMDVVHAFRG